MGPLLRHTCQDTGPRFLRSHPKDRPYLDLMDRPYLDLKHRLYLDLKDCPYEDLKDRPI